MKKFYESPIAEITVVETENIMVASEETPVLPPSTPEPQQLTRLADASIKGEGTVDWNF